ncbi:MAG: nucleotidyltransferase domain-containing protein [Anaerolineae bacterium]
MNEQVKPDVLQKLRDVAYRVDASFSHHHEVSSILVFGSTATGYVDERSDVDMLIICRSGLLSVTDRENILSELGSNWRFHDQSNNNALFADIDVGSLVDSVLVEVHYQTASWVSEVLAKVLDHGAITTEKLPFRPYTLPALLQRAWLLTDKDGTVKQWCEKAKIFPEQLKINILRHFVPILRENLAELQANADRGLGPRGFIFFLNWAVDAMTSILFALNEIYDPADRRAECTILPTLTYVPQNFIPIFTEVMQGPFDDAGALYRATLFESLAIEVLKMAEAQQKL